MTNQGIAHGPFDEVPMLNISNGKSTSYGLNANGVAGNGVEVEMGSIGIGFSLLPGTTAKHLTDPVVVGSLPSQVGAVKDDQLAAAMPINLSSIILVSCHSERPTGAKNLHFGVNSPLTVEIPRHFVPRNDMLNEFSSSGY
jgi:hypothetical protein